MASFWNNVDEFFGKVMGFAENAYVVAQAFAEKKTYTWEHYGLKMIIPFDFEVKANTNEKFVVESPLSGSISIYFLQDNEANLLEIKRASSVFVRNNIAFSNIYDEDRIYQNGLDGYGVYGTQSIYSIIFLGLQNKRTDTQIFVVVKWLSNMKIAGLGCSAVAKSISQY
jgi:hypothetical protein